MNIRFLKTSFFIILIFSLQSCMTTPPQNPDNICLIFEEKKSWYKAAMKAEKRWKIPPYVLMSIVYQESSFKADAKPCLLYTSPSPRDRQKSRMPSSA